MVGSRVIYAAVGVAVAVIVGLYALGITGKLPYVPIAPWSLAAQGGAIGIASKWYGNMFIPYEGYKVSGLEYYFPDCDFEAKDQVELASQMEKYEKCKMEVALALEMWRYIAEGRTNVNMSYLREYGVPDTAIERMERWVKEATVEYHGLKTTASVQAITLLLGEKTAQVATEAGREWYEALARAR